MKVKTQHIKIWERIQNGDWDTNAEYVSSGNQEPCWDAGDMIGWGKAPGRAETLAHRTPRPWKASPHHDTLKEQTKNRQAATPMPPPACQPTMPPPHWSTGSLPCRPAMLLPTGLQSHQPLPTTGGPQYHQWLVPNLPRRWRQRGLDAKGVTLKLLILKFYCSWIRDFFFLFFFLFFKCLFVLFSVWLCTISPCWFL
jgi:hypothetical protein